MRYRIWFWLHALRPRDRFWLLWHTRIHPSRMQRLHNAGNPTGEVTAFADKIINEMREEGTWE
jgi:hypothetical protein